MKNHRPCGQQFFRQRAAWFELFQKLILTIGHVCLCLTQLQAGK